MNLKKIGFKQHLTNVSAVQSVGGFGLNRSDSGWVGLFGRDRSDPAAHAKHYAHLLF